MKLNIALIPMIFLLACGSAHAGPVVVESTTAVDEAAAAQHEAKIAALANKPRPSKNSPLSSVAPLPEGAEVGWSHAPYEMGDCSICHENSSTDKPGPVKVAGNQLCFECHEQIAEILDKRQFPHQAAKESCTSCHNPHNGAERGLLREKVATVCLDCHKKIAKLVKTSTVTHGATNNDKACVNCHNPHATNVEHLLAQLPYDLCVGCHSRDGIVDDDGVKLANMKTLIDNNPVRHEPVEKKDCSACHEPHGGKNFRLLTSPYPEKFYAKYESDNYALCFSCHNDQIMSKPKTTTLTGFRDGSRNLHYLHVNKKSRGRTCRACHEVHAAKQDHHIREGVPYGSKGWVLKINYKRTDTGGICEKTCHTARSYTNRVQTTSFERPRTGGGS